MRWRSFLLGLARRRLGTVVLLAALLSGCGGGGERGEISVGVAVSSHGPSAAVRDDVIRGVETAVAEVNAAGGIKARNLKVVVEEFGSDTDAGVKAVHRLIDDQRAALIVNGTRSDVFANWAEYARSKDVVVINAAASSPLVSRLGGTVYTVAVAHADLGDELAKWALESGHRKLVLLLPSGQLGSELQRGAAERARRMGGRVAETIFYEPGHPDYRDEVSRLVSGSPEAILAALDGADGRRLFEQAARVGVSGPWYLAYPSQLEATDPSSADGRVFGIEVAYTQQAAEKFRASYAARYENALPGPWAAYSFDGTWMVAYAMRRVGTEASKMAQVFARGGKGYAGATGILTFDNYGHRTPSPLERMMVTGGGKLVPFGK